MINIRNNKIRFFYHPTIAGNNSKFFWYILYWRIYYGIVSTSIKHIVYFCLIGNVHVWSYKYDLAVLMLFLYAMAYIGAHHIKIAVTSTIKHPLIFIFGVFNNCISYCKAQFVFAN